MQMVRFPWHEKSRWPESTCPWSTRTKVCDKHDLFNVPNADRTMTVIPFNVRLMCCAAYSVRINGPFSGFVYVTISYERVLDGRDYVFDKFGPVSDVSVLFHARRVCWDSNWDPITRCWMPSVLVFGAYAYAKNESDGPDREVQSINLPGVVLLSWPQ